MVTLIYTHSHACKFEDETFEVRPSVSSGAYPLVPIMCTDIHEELELISRTVA